MKVDYSFTIEFPSRPPKTFTGPVVASQPNALLRAALRSALRAAKGESRGWSSYVLVLQACEPEEAGS